MKFYCLIIICCSFCALAQPKNGSAAVVAKQDCARLPKAELVKKEKLSDFVPVPGNCKLVTWELAYSADGKIQSFKSNEERLSEEAKNNLLLANFGKKIQLELKMECNKKVKVSTYCYTIVKR